MNLAMNGPLARRLRLATMPAPPGVRGPSLRLWLGEGLRVVPPRPGSAQKVEPARNPRSVMLFPGFGAHPRTMRRMHAALAQAGHEVHDWGEGWNLGTTAEMLDRQADQLATLATRTERRLVLVGWSLGGIIARELAHRVPDAVGGVITMGSPFSGDRHANNAWRTYQLVTGHEVTNPPVATDFAAKPPVPTVALWSPRDGIVAPRAACGWPEERDRAVSIRCSHLDFASSPAVIAEVLRQLDVEE